MCELPDARRIEGSRHTVSFRTLPARVAVGEPFVVEIAACARGAAGAAEIAANAHMPEHRHGMNYRPTVRALGDGRFRSEGWLFHMPGRWEFVFDVGGERMTDSLQLE